MNYWRRLLAAFLNHPDPRIMKAIENLQAQIDALKKTVDALVAQGPPAATEAQLNDAATSIGDANTALLTLLPPPAGS